MEIKGTQTTANIYCKVIEDEALEQIKTICNHTAMEGCNKIISKLQAEKLNNWILCSISSRFRLEVKKIDEGTEYKLFTKYGKKEISKIIL